MATLNIGKDFSPDPIGRFKNDAPGQNGEEFREYFLKKMLLSLEKKEKLTVILDDEIDGYGSSFLVEGFAGVVKYGYMDSVNMLEKLNFRYDDKDFEFYEKKIIQYIKESKFNSMVYNGS